MKLTILLPERARKTGVWYKETDHKACKLAISRSLSSHYTQGNIRKQEMWYKSPIRERDFQLCHGNSLGILMFCRIIGDNSLNEDLALSFCKPAYVCKANGMLRTLWEENAEYDAGRYSYESFDLRRSTLLSIISIWCRVTYYEKPTPVVEISQLVAHTALNMTKHVHVRFIPRPLTIASR